ncbi:hypothetical protein EI94DRAFT_1728229 [Lactarius quietus]|nr:hypothetical protein EI94DRAFT_1728229 [Lactarius quietus]
MEDPYADDEAPKMEVIEETPEEEEEGIYAGEESAQDMYMIEDPEAEWPPATATHTEPHGLEPWDESEQPFEMFIATKPSPETSLETFSVPVLSLSVQQRTRALTRITSRFEKLRRRASEYISVCPYSGLV